MPLTDSSHTYPSRLEIVHHAEKVSFPYHISSFISGKYSFASRLSGASYVFTDSIVLPTTGKHPYMQACISLDHKDDLVVLFFGEEYGFPTAIYENQSLNILYGSSDYLNHARLLADNMDLFLHLRKSLAERSRSADQATLENLEVCRMISVGAANSVGHNLINDMPALWNLCRAAGRHGVEYSFLTFRMGMFDALVKDNLLAAGYFSNDIKASTDLLFNWPWSRKRYFSVRPFGYGFNRDFVRRIITGAEKPSRDTLWINIRCETEERYDRQSESAISGIAIALLSDASISTIVFDGLTNLMDDVSDAPMQATLANQKRIASKLKKEIDDATFYRELEYVDLIGQAMHDKILALRRIRYFIGTFGSGTWPTSLSTNATAYILLSGHNKRGLKTDPSYDFTRFEDSTHRIVISL